MNKPWIEDVLAFWFGEITEQDWFRSTPQLDKQIKERFESPHAMLISDSTPPENATPRWSLASVILLDQFSRNMYRGTAQAFASDATALSIAKYAVEKKHDANMTADERQFLYMPFMHSENLTDQEQSVLLFEKLGRPEYAIAHREIVARFGRYPHRNEVLDRQSTPEEKEYLKDAKRYGQ